MPTENRPSNTEHMVNARVCAYTPGQSQVELQLIPHRPLPSWLELGQAVTVRPAKQHQGEPVAVLYANGSVLTKADCGDAFEICCKVETPLYTHTDPSEIERLKQDLLVARAQGRAEVVEMIIALEAETGLDEFIGSHQIGCTGEWGSHWKEDDLRNVMV